MLRKTVVARTERDAFGVDGRHSYINVRLLLGTDPISAAVTGFFRRRRALNHY